MRLAIEIAATFIVIRVILEEVLPLAPQLRVDGGQHR